MTFISVMLPALHTHTHQFIRCILQRTLLVMKVSPLSTEINGVVLVIIRTYWVSRAEYQDSFSYYRPLCYSDLTVCSSWILHYICYCYPNNTCYANELNFPNQQLYRKANRRWRCVRVFTSSRSCQPSSTNWVIMRMRNQRLLWLFSPFCWSTQRWRLPR